MPKFKVLAGKHADWCPEGKNPNHTYSKGDIVFTKSDLLKMNQPGAVKFELIPGTENEMPPTPVPTTQPSAAEPSKPTPSASPSKTTRG